MVEHENGTAEPASADVTPVVPVILPPAPMTPGPASPVAEKPRSGKAGILIASLLVAVIAGGAAGLGAYYVAPDLLGKGPVREIEVKTSTDEVVVAAVAKALPSVVNIDVTGESTSDDLPGTHPSIPMMGSGSGVVYKVTGDGSSYIITNDHVAGDASRIVVTDAEGEKHEGELVGTDPESDIAVIKIDVELPTITLGSSEDVQVGQMAIAIGSPFGLQHSVTAGVVSAIHRSLPDSISDGARYPLVDVIQTDASINPGNSGGALVDRSGKLIGIPTAIFSDTGGADGVGFAVPVRTVVRVADQLIEGGKAEHAFLGIVGQTITELLAEEMDLPMTEGALVVEITPDTGAAKAGLATDDIIVQLDAERIRSMDDLILAVKRRSVGDVVLVKFYRNGEVTELEMTLGVKPDNL
ncbi:MAG: trypsin-like peptidase domain-containing protein [Coriobacteriia bacterium]|nr:trypsin-like peptidase domain-containing protein [Coriobacteriia bacterium]